MDGPNRTEVCFSAADVAFSLSMNGFAPFRLSDPAGFAIDINLAYAIVGGHDLHFPDALAMFFFRLNHLAGNLLLCGLNRLLNRNPCGLAHLQFSLFLRRMLFLMLFVFL